MLAEVHNPCGLVQGLEPGLNRYYGSTLAAVLSCGRVAFIMAIAGGESLTQVYGMLAAVCTRRSLKFVVYDNACALGRFVRGLARRRAGSSSTAAVSSHLLYVLDRWHEQNHTACLDPSHRLYMPEVHMDQYSELNDYDSTLSETFNAWLELFCPVHATHVAGDIRRLHHSAFRPLERARCCAAFLLPRRILAASRRCQAAPQAGTVPALT